MDLTSLRHAVYRRTGLVDSPVAGVASRVLDSLNRRHRMLLSTPGITGLRRVFITDASVANQADYGVALAKILTISERDNDRELIEKSLAWYRETNPDPSANTGTPEYWVSLGTSRIERRPANASEIFIISDSASDTGTAFVEAIRSNGYHRTMSVTINGVTAATLDSAITDVEDIVDFYISTAAVGTITLREDSGTGNILATIPIGKTYARYQRYALVPRPGAVVTYHLDGLVRIVDFANATDEPLIPEDFHDVLADWGVYDELLYNGHDDAAQRLLMGDPSTGFGGIAMRTLQLKAFLFHSPSERGERPRSLKSQFAKVT